MSGQRTDAQADLGTRKSHILMTWLSRIARMRMRWNGHVH